MNGKMLWFNSEKGYGYIQTENDERLYVASAGFLPKEEPTSRCAGRHVTFERTDEVGEPRAVDVACRPGVRAAESCPPAHAAQRLEALVV